MWKGAIVLYHDKEKGKEGDSNNDNSWSKKRNLKARGGVNSLYPIKVVMAAINGYYYMLEGIYDEICECLSTP